MSIIILSVQSQLEDIIYLCIVDDNNINLIQVAATEPVGFMFSQTVGVYVYSDSSNPLIADIIHVTPDTVSGTYRRTGDVLRGAYTTASDSIPQQGSLNSRNQGPNTPPMVMCEGQYSDELEGLDRTILLPLSTNQALAVHRVNTEIPYDIPDRTLMIGAVGFFFQEATIAAMYPHFQLLRFSGGSEDVVSFSLPGLGN
ncbi:MAG: hypothetical protein Q9P01_13995 [Anaerolineae bacterium]|nr:hypothetical protein [Anaerolineae bacterium]